MNQNIYEYVHRLHEYMTTQEQRIMQLEDTLRQLQDQLNEWREKPPFSVGTIEYKFDQLKVETLEGTLNIGLNPADLEEIEDFSVTRLDDAPTSLTNEMRETLIHYLHQELPTFIQEINKELRLELADSHIDFIKNDLEKQLPKQIDHYLTKNGLRNVSIHEIAKSEKEQIITQMKQDTERAVLNYLNHFKTQVNEVEQN